VTVQQTQSTAAGTHTNGRLLVLEFNALGSGQTSIDVNSGETKLMLANQAKAQFNASPVRIEISNPQVSQLENEK